MQQKFSNDKLQKFVTFQDLVIGNFVAIFEDYRYIFYELRWSNSQKWDYPIEFNNLSKYFSEFLNVNIFYKIATFHRQSPIVHSKNLLR